MSLPRIRQSTDLNAKGTRTLKNGAVLVNSFQSLVAFQSRSCEDVVTDNYHERVKNGQIINNPFVYAVSRSYVQGAGYHRAKSSGADYIWSGTGSLTSHIHNYVAPSARATPLPDLSDSDGARKDAMSRCIANIDSTPYSFAEDVFELRETLRFLKDPLSSLRDLSRQFSKDVNRYSNSKKTLNRAKALSSVWLQYRFAFSPLVRSATDLLQASLQNEKTPPTRRSAHGYSDYQYSNSDTQVKSGLTWDQTLVVKGNIHASLLYDIPNPVTGWRYQYGLRFKDIPETLWAVFPYSFMVDRIVNVSDVVRGVTNLLDPRMVILAGSVTNRKDLSKTLSFRKQTSAGYTMTTSPDTNVTEEFGMVREVWSPTVTDTIPSVSLTGLVSDATKIVDLVALVTQNIRV